MEDKDKPTPVGQAATAKKAEVNEGAQSDIIKKHAHGVDETGHAAPDQVDQALINKDRLEKEKSDPNAMRDERWPAHRSMSVIAPDQTEGTKKLTADYNKDLEKSREVHGPKMGESTQADKQAERRNE